MKRKKYLRLLLLIAGFILLIIFLLPVLMQPWLRRKIETSVNETGKYYQIEIEKVHISLIKSGIKLENITIGSKLGEAGSRDINGGIGRISLEGINFFKALLNHKIDIKRVFVSNCNIDMKIPLPGEEKPPVLFPIDVRIGKILVETINLKIANALSAQSYSVKEGKCTVSDLKVNKLDTLLPGIIEKLDLEAEELMWVSPDSMYSYTIQGIFYSAVSNTLAIDCFSVRPNYPDYEFAARHKYQTDCINAEFSEIFVHDFYAQSYFKSGSMVSTNIEISKMDLEIFHDKRKEFRHVRKPAFQDLIYNYPGLIDIDSVVIRNGSIRYTEQEVEATAPGRISFSEIDVKIYKITNDTVYKAEKASLELNASALLMGSSRMTIGLKGRLFDSENTFTLNGTLSPIAASELNPILEHNAFIYATSGKIDAMKFNFTANNQRATGKMTLLYHGLDIAIKNKHTDDTTAIRERVISIAANMKLLNSNPIPEKEVRVGIIYYERDPERFLFNYSFKSILTGIKSSIAENPAK